MVLRNIAGPGLDSLFRPPARSGVSSAWWEHLPFASFLVTQTRPSIIVELGSHNGVSFSGFCEAVKQAHIPSRCYAVDSWAGDPHAGFYGEDIYKDLKSFIDHRYKSCAELIRSTFDEAALHFEDETIDLLHIDGLHTYEAVKSDFYTWNPKLSRRGVVLFHDTNVRHGDFGVHRFWNEIKSQYPNFEFLHGHGLGVLAVGMDRHPFIEDLCALDEQEIFAVRDRLSCIGARWAAAEWIGRLEKHMADYTQYTKNLESEHSKIREEVTQARQQFSDCERELGNKDAQICVLRQEIVRLEQELMRSEFALHSNSASNISEQAIGGE